MLTARHKAIAVCCDVADEAQVKAMVEHTVSAFGRLDAAFNNAGVQSMCGSSDASVQSSTRECDQLRASGVA